MLPSAILLGLLLPQAHVLAWLVRWLLAGMVFLAFIAPGKASWRDSWKVLGRTVPVWLLLAPLLAMAMHALFPSHPGLALAAFMVCVAPTATAAPAVVRMSGGDPTIVVTSVVLQHLAVGLLIPFWVLLLGPEIGVATQGGYGVWEIPRQILVGTLPLVVLPLAFARVVRTSLPMLADRVARVRFLSLVLWAFAVFLVVARARGELGALVQASELKGATGQSLAWQLGGIALVSLVLCLFQFGLGRVLVPGAHREEGAQVLGQKNTILAIWVAGTWFGPWASLGPLFYVLWQNLYIAWQASRSVKIG